MSESEQLAPGTVVRVVSRGHLVGAVTGWTSVGDDVRYDVLHDGAIHQYYAGQLEVAQVPEAGHVPGRKLQVGLTAELLLDRATEYLHTLNAGRIDFEPYQYRPVLTMVQADSPRLLVADDVGVGKTIEAALVLKELQARGEAESVLIICPRPLVVDGKWRDELKRFDEDFVHLDGPTLRACLEETYREGTWPERYRKAIVPYSLLDQTTLQGERQGRTPRVGLVDLAPGPRFDLLIVDEAHHIRNPQTWSYRNVAHLTDAARAVVMLSATPVQTTSTDLYTLVHLLRDDLVADQADFAAMLEPNAHLHEAVEAARAGRAGWQADAARALDAALSTSWGGQVMRFDPRVSQARQLLDGDDGDTTRVRAVRALQDLNTFSDVINRTRRRDIGEFTTRKPSTVVVSFTSEQEAVYRELMALARTIVGRRAPAVPVQFLLSMLQRQAASSLTALGPLVEDILSNRLAPGESAEIGDDDVDLPRDVVTELADEIRRLGRAAAALREGPDPKVEALRRIVEEKSVEDNNKVLVFSTFRHTLAYVEECLARWGIRAAVIHGGLPDDARRDLRRRFRRPREEHEAIDVLLSSEVGTEGLDYQFCDALVNYDLPWNPMRIEQRIGRIDRRGQRSDVVVIYNLLTAGTVESEIYDRCLLRIGVFHRSLGGSEAILGELTTRITAIADDLSLTEEERLARLRQLADNQIRRVEEQTRLEDAQAELFGLAADFASRVDEQTTVWLDDSRVARLVLDYLDRIQPGRRIALRPGRIATVRLSHEVAERVRRDLRSARVPNQRLERILSRQDPVLRLTTDPDLVEGEPDVELLGPTHPLVRVAAEGARLERQVTASMRVASDLVPPGRYEIAVHGWTHVGRRDRFGLRYVSQDPLCEQHAAELLAEADDAAQPRAASGADALERRHHELWRREKERHVEASSTLLDRQARNLRARHARRVLSLESRGATVTDPGIQAMTRRQIENEQLNLDRQLEELEEARTSADVIARHLATVTLEVVTP